MVAWVSGRIQNVLTFAVIFQCSKLGITSISKYIVVALDNEKTFWTWNCCQGDSHPSDITCLSVDAFLVFTACENEIRAFQNNKQVVHTYKGHQHPVHLLLPYGKHLISVDDASCLKIWDITSEGSLALLLLISLSNYSERKILQNFIWSWNSRTPPSKSRPFFTRALTWIKFCWEASKEQCNCGTSTRINSSSLSMVGTLPWRLLNR